MSEPARPISKSTLTAWVNEKIRNGTPRCVLYHILISMQSETNDLKEMQILAAVADEQEEIMVDRNTKGMALEKQGKEDSAIVLYEANVADQFDGSHPYNRLRILYMDRGSYIDTIRVCEAYIANSSQDQKLCESFRTEITKLTAKASGS